MPDLERPALILRAAGVPLAGRVASGNYVTGADLRPGCCVWATTRDGEDILGVQFYGPDGIRCLDKLRTNLEAADFTYYHWKKDDYVARRSKALATSRVRIEFYRALPPVSSGLPDSKAAQLTRWAIQGLVMSV